MKNQIQVTSIQTDADGGSQETDIYCQAR